MDVLTLIDGDGWRAGRLGQEVYEDFLDNTVLADRQTSVRTHLGKDPTILEELPPEALRERYCG